MGVFQMVYQIKIALHDTTVGVCKICKISSDKLIYIEKRIWGIGYKDYSRIYNGDMGLGSRALWRVGYKA